MKIFITCVASLSLFLGFIFMDAPKLKRSDLQLLTGAQWTGTLTYLDYSTNKKVSIASKLLVTQSSAGKFAWVFDYQYPDEPKANGTKEVILSPDGTTISGEKVVERTKVDGSPLRITTEKTGSENDKQALFRFTYLISAKSFSIKKEVRYEGTTDFIERNQYSWTR